MSVNKKPSGAQFRKRAAKKQLEEEKVLKKVPKISNFFNIVSLVSEPEQLQCSSSGTQNNTIETQSSDTFDIDTLGQQSMPDTDTLVLTEEPNSDTNTPKIKEQDHFVLEDPASWNIKDEMQVTKIIHSNIKQDLQADFSKSERCYNNANSNNPKRMLSVNLFYAQHSNGEHFKRDWLLYSKSTGRIFCIFCLLFQPEKKRTSFSEGFNDWKHSFALAKQHEQSEDHRANVLTYISRKKASPVEKLVLCQYETEVKYWREVLTRVVCVVKFLSVRGLPFRGDNQQHGSISNGLFLGCLELISEFDPFLAQHLAKYGNKGKGSVSYLSSDICNEFIDILSNRVLQEILEEINSARYFSLVIDSTPDASNTDQLAVVLRYVSFNDACATERLIRVLPGVSHKSEGLEEATLNLLEKLELDINNCRGQSYDNASNMSGMYSGLQSRIRSKNELAEYVPCAAHSLNLAGCFAAEKACTEATIFFSFLQGLYNFFSSSTYRWDVLRGHVQNSNEGKHKTQRRTLMLKSLSETRWSARADALRALVTGYKEIKNALEDLIKDNTQTPDTRLNAEGFRKTMDKFQTILLTVIWDEILQKMDKISETLQKEELDLLGATKQLQALSMFLSEKRSSFDDYEATALQLANVRVPSYEKIRKRTIFSDESKDIRCEQMDPRDRFRTGVFLSIIDSLVTQLNKRRDCYEALNTRFQIFRNMHEKEPQDLTNQAKELAKNYPNDIEEENFVQECQHFKMYMKMENLTQTKVIYTYIKENGLESTFPNLEVAIRIYLTLPVTNCTAERSFSALKRIKSEMRSTMTNEKLNSLMLLCTQSDITMKLDCKEIIDDFARVKARKKSMV